MNEHLRLLLELNYKANIFCLKSDPDDLPSATVSSVEEAHAKNEHENFILCKNCGSPLASINFKISVNGNHTHAFVNPYGMVFEIACFSKAPGCHKPFFNHAAASSAK